jgi:hypothetical protein
MCQNCEKNSIEQCYFTLWRHYDASGLCSLATSRTAAGHRRTAPYRVPRPALARRSARYGPPCVAPPPSPTPGAPRAARAMARPRRPRHFCSAAAAHWWPPRPNLHHQSIEGKANRTPCPLVCLPKPHLAAGEHATTVGVRCGKPRAHLWRFKNSRGLCRRKFDYVSVIFIFICINPLNTS